MSTWPALLLLIGIAVLLAWGARRIQVPIPIVLVLGGLALAFVPGLPAIEVDPHLILLLVLPPILFQAAIFSSYVVSWVAVSLLWIWLLDPQYGLIAYLLRHRRVRPP